MAGLLNAVIFGVNGVMKRMIHKDKDTPIPLPKVSSTFSSRYPASPSHSCLT
jgi:hypothetical protein